MIINKNILGIIAAGTLLLTACKKDFQKINTDPSNPQSVTPGAMLGQMEYRFVNASITAAKSFNHELMQVTAPQISPSGGIHRYQIDPDVNGGIWGGFYALMADVKDLNTMSGRLGENNYKAIALVYKSWAFSILTDVFGDVPYSEAAEAASGIVQPKFDKQKDIYTGILKDLDSANNLFDSSKALTYAGDYLYNANTVTSGKNPGIIKWKKFGNSLRLRILLRISKRDGELPVNQQISNILGDPGKYPIFTSTDDDAIFAYPGTYPFYNPYYNARALDWRQQDYYTMFFIDKMNKDVDPRRAVWATKVKVNNVDTFQGIQSGYKSDVTYVIDKNSSYNDNLKTYPKLGVMMTYAEVRFILAELQLKGFNTGATAQSHYEKGITASITQWGGTVPAGYLSQSGVQYDPTADNDTQLQQIMLQKYYAYYFVDFQSWFEKRRTGYPVLPRGLGIPAENQFPSRCLYPTYLQSLNPKNLAAAIQDLGGSDKSTIKCWWEK